MRQIKEVVRQIDTPRTVSMERCSMTAVPFQVVQPHRTAMLGELRPLGHSYAASNGSNCGVQWEYALWPRAYSYCMAIPLFVAGNSLRMSRICTGNIRVRKITEGCALARNKDILLAIDIL